MGFRVKKQAMTLHYKKDKPTAYKLQLVREQTVKYKQLCKNIASSTGIRKGEVEEWELVGAIRSIVSALQTTLDGQGRLEDYWLGQAVAGLKEGPEELARRVEQVTLADVVAIANQVKLDTVYFLKGKEE